MERQQQRQRVTGYVKQKKNSHLEIFRENLPILQRKSASALILVHRVGWKDEIYSTTYDCTHFVFTSEEGKVSVHHVRDSIVESVAAYMDYASRARFRQIFISHSIQSIRCVSVRYVYAKCICWWITNRSRESAPISSSSLECPRNVYL